MITKRLFKKLKFYISVFVVIALGLWYFSSKEDTTLLPVSNNTSSNGKAMSVSFLDVGQGDCTFIALPDGKTVLIDAANPGDGENIVNYLKANNVKRLDYVVATHPHADHIGGMSYIIDTLEIGEIFAPKIASSDIPTTKTYENFLLSVKNKGLKITAAKGGYTLFEGEGYKAECFAPNNEKNDGLNNYSIILKLTHQNDTFLFTGDAEAEIEKEVLNKAYNIDCDVLKVGHHGSSSSSINAFLKAVTPKYAVISCGRDNSYGHPHSETLTALNSINGLINIYRTDTDKTITALSNGNGEISFTTGGKTVVSGE